MKEGELRLLNRLTGRQAGSGTEAGQQQQQQQHVRIQQQQQGGETETTYCVPSAAHAGLLLLLRPRPGAQNALALRE